MDPWAAVKGTPMALRTCEGSREPEVQAEPEEAQIPRSESRQEDRFSLHIFKTDAHGVGKSMDSIPVDQGIRNLLQNLRLEIIPQGLDPRVLLIEMLFGQFAGLSETDDVGDILRPSPSPLLLVATDQERRKFGPLSNIEDSNPFGRMEFMAGDGKHIDRRFLHIERNLPGCLDSIGVERNPLRLHDLTDFFNGKDHTCFIIGIHDVTRAVSSVMRLPQLIQIQPSLSIHGKFGDPVALSTQIG